MAESDSRYHVYTPGSLNELLLLKRAHPRASIYAGGTDLLKGVSEERFAVPDEVISLQEVEELQRISRTDRYLDIGAAATVARILAVGAKVIPASLVDALNHVGPPGLHSLATIGGNICSRNHLFSLVPLLTIMDVRYEIRRLGQSRWVAAARFRDAAGAPGLAVDEVLVRVRMPLDQWNVQLFEQMGTIYLRDTQPVVFCALAKRNKGILDDFRMAFSAHRPLLYRNRDLEADLVGRKLPLPRREAHAFLRGVEEGIAAPEFELSGIQRHRGIALTRRFLSALSQ